MTTKNVTPSSATDNVKERLRTRSENRERGPVKQLIYALSQTEVAITMVALALFVFFSLAADSFLTTSSLLEVLRSSSYVGIVAAAWALLLIVGELDLSPGALYALLMVVNGSMINDTDLGMWGSFFVLILIGAAIGAAQGMIVTSFGVPSFIVTLGTLSLFQGVALWVSSSLPITVTNDLESSFVQLGGGTVGGIPVVVIWLLVVMLVCGGVLRYTSLGYHMYATGGSKKAAAQAGINTAFVKVVAFALVGASVGVCAALSVAQLGSASPIASGTFNLTVIAAVIIGGVALEGGAGRVYGAFIGSLILGMVETGIILMGASADLHYLISGAILVGAGVVYAVLRGSLPSGGVVAKLRSSLTRSRWRSAT